MVVKCPRCNHFVNDMALTCPHCGAILKEEESSSKVANFEEEVSESTNIEENSVAYPQSSQIEQPETTAFQNSPQLDEMQPETPQAEMPQEETTPICSAPVAPMPSSVAYQRAKKSNSTLIAIIVLLAIIICGVGGYFYYNNVYLPEKIDREAPRYYSMANVIVLRSSRSAGADFNKVASLPYGTELITYEIDGEWARVKVKSQNGEGLEGYVSSQYILNKADFFLMNSIFGNQDSKEAIVTTKCRIALLNYFKQRQYIGKIDDQMRLDAGISTVPNSENQWQVFTKPKDAKPNSFFFKRLINKSSQYTDFAVIITNSVTGLRKLLYFYFDDNETPHFLAEQEVPSQGYIVDITYEYDFYSASRVLNVTYSY